MTEEPDYYGLTVDQHLAYIEGLHDTFEKRYIMVKRLKYKINKDIEKSSTQIEKKLLPVALACGFKTKDFLDEISSDKRNLLASRRVEAITRNINSYLDKLDEENFQFSKFPSWEAFRKKILHPEPETKGASHQKPLSLADRYRESPKDLLFPSSEFSRNMEELIKTVREIHAALDGKGDLTLFITQLETEDKARQVPQGRFFRLQSAEIALLALLAHDELFEEYREALEETGKSIDRIILLNKFKQELEEKTENLKNLAEIYVDNVLDAAKINWLKAKSDCKRLWLFLSDNGWVDEKSDINKFLSAHFLFKGESSTPEQIQKLNINRHEGKIRDSGNLTIFRY